MEKRWACLAASIVLLRGAAAADTQISIDILPGETRNLVDMDARDAVPVALLASETFDPHLVEPATVRLAGASTVKNDAGIDHAFQDVDGDGREDLIVWFAARELRIGDADDVARLEGTTKEGVTLFGRDAIRTLARARREASLPLSQTTEKRTPVTASLERLPDGAIAILATRDLDPARIVLDSIRIDGRPTGKTKDGDVASLTDVNGDGRTDLVVTSRDPGAQGSALSAITADGYEMTGTTEQSTARPAVEIVPEEPPPSDQPLNQFPGAITIGDGAPPIVASPYPATISVSGLGGVISKLRVTLNRLSHECPRDLDIMLVGPTGQNLVLMSDVAECSGGLMTLTFDDFAPTTVPLSSFLFGTLSFRPSNEGLGDAFPAPAPIPSQASSLSVFNGTNPNGDWKLYVVDDATFHTGAILGGWTLDITTMTQICTAPTPSLIPAGAPGTTAGPAENYGSWVFVSGMPNRISKVSVTLKGLTHGRVDDLDVLLVSPAGGKSLLMASAGGTTAITDTDLTFDDMSTIGIADVGGIFGSGTYRPSVYSNFVFAAPAPGLPYPDTLKSLISWDPNGTWRLYIQDHTTGAGSTGVLAGGWCLNVTTIAPTEACQLQAMTIPGISGNTAGPAVPYPSTLDVTGTTGRIDHMQIKLLGLTHTYPDDLDILLQAPSGKSIWLMSDAGGGGDVVNQNVTFDTGFTGVNDLPDEGPVGPGPYSPAPYEPGDSVPAPGPGAPTDTSLYEEAPNGQWKLWVNDDAGADVGSMAGWCMNFSLFEPYSTHCSTGGNFLTIPSGGTSGPASAFPWNAQVTEQGTTIGRLVVHLYGLTHTWPDDLDVLLVGPTGMKTLLMSDAGGGDDVNGIDLYFDDYAAGPLPDSGQLVTGARVWPTDYDGGDGDAFPAPAPPGPYGTNLSAFAGTDPMGTWGLYVRDDADFDVGDAMQWCLEVYPQFPSAEVTNVRWKDKNTLQWDAPANAWGYGIRRGTAADFGKLLSTDVDSCNGGGGIGQTASASSVPAPGTLQWYLILGSVGAGLPVGTPGTVRIGGAETTRIVDATSGCPAPL